MPAGTFATEQSCPARGRYVVNSIIGPEHSSHRDWSYQHGSDGGLVSALDRRDEVQGLYVFKTPVRKATAFLGIR